MEWKDPRVQFWNLKEKKTLNILTSHEKLQIWIPTLVFFNTDHKTRSVSDQETLVYVTKNGNFSINEPNEIDNINVFNGAENSLIINRIFETKWICTYAMNFFLFDTQKCLMVVTPTEELADFVQ